MKRYPWARSQIEADLIAENIALRVALSSAVTHLKWLSGYMASDSWDRTVTDIEIEGAKRALNDEEKAS